jgi:CheY-like chemotaxis protein
MMILDTLEKGLSLGVYQCKVTMSPTQAFELFSKKVFDVMVTDILLPDMSGFELTAKTLRIDLTERGQT